MDNAQIVRPDIQEFMFPCPACGSETFHRIVEEFGGITLKLIFRKKPLFASQKANQVVCLRCLTINGRMSEDDVSKLSAGYIPKSIHERYQQVAEFYSLAMLERVAERFADDPESLAEWQESIRKYRLEL